MRDREKVRANQRRWRIANAERERIRKAEWRRANPEKDKAAKDLWKAVNPEKKKAAEKNWRDKNSDKRRESVRQWRKTNPDKYKAQIKRNAPRAHRKREYGLTQDGWDEMFVRQGGLCAICKDPIKSRKLNVDHCHQTKKVRGLLCRKCNTALGGFEDNVSLLLTAIEYLTKS